MPRKKLPYKEGDWFAVPLRSTGYAIGLIARTNCKGIGIGYFFGPKSDSVPSLGLANAKAPSDALLVAKFGDLGLLEGRWKVLGRLQSWKRQDWPIPVFVRTDLISGVYHKVVYSEDNLLTEIELLPCSAKEASELPKDGTSGDGAVELKLTKLLYQTTQAE